MLQHPSQALELTKTPRFISVCDHYAGKESTMRKSMSLQKAKEAMFDITFDCEDGAAVGQEAEHIRMICDLINSPENAFNRIGVRIHGVNHPSFVDDLQTLISLAGDRVAYIVIPKIYSANDVSHAVDSIDYLSQQAGIKQTIPVHVLIETHTALREVFRIAAHPRLECLSFGLMDFVSSHHGAIDSHALSAHGQFEHSLIQRAKLEISAACHAYNKTPAHNVILEFSDPTLVYESALKAKQALGFTRIWSIHPSQIDPILRAMLPTTDELEQAQEIIERAAKNQWAPISIMNAQGIKSLHDRASYRYFWQLISKSHAQGMVISNTTIQSFL